MRSASFISNLTKGCAKYKHVDLPASLRSSSAIEKQSAYRASMDHTKLEMWIITKCVLFNYTISNGCNIKADIIVELTYRNLKRKDLSDASHSYFVN